MESLEIDGKKLSWFQQGVGDTLLFLHGFPLSHQMWLHQLEALSTDYQVVAPDLPGFGLSEIHDDLENLGQVANILEQLLTHLGMTQCTVIGLSMGGYIAWELADRFPQRVSRMILLDTRAAADSSEVVRGRRLMAKTLDRSGAGALEEVASTMTPKLVAAQSFRNARWEVEQVRQWIQSASAESVARYQLAMAGRADFSKQLASFKMPSLVLCGEYDQITPVVEMREMTRGLPDATFVEVPNAGHLAPLESSEFVNAAIRKFLKKTSSLS